MLQKCLKNLGDEPDPQDVNVQVLIGCCGGTVKGVNIEQQEEEEEDNGSSSSSSGRGSSDESKKKKKGKETAEFDERDGKTIKRDLLRPQPPSWPRLCCCFSKCRRRIPAKDESVANKTADLHPPSSSSKDLSES